MCIVSSKIKFCTCVGGSYNELPHYWVLHRFDKQKDLQCIGEPIMPYDFLQQDYQSTQQTIATRLNESDAFDKAIKFYSKDQLEIVINNLAEDETKRMIFCFKYKKDKWLAEEFDTFELMNRYNEWAFGNIDKLDNK